MKIPDRDLKQMIIDGLSQLPVYYPNRDRSQHTIRCQACGDSRNLSHAHLSIHIDVEDDLPMFYRCFRCNDSGLVTRAKLVDWGVDIPSQDVNESLNIYNKKSTKIYKNKFSDNWESYIAPKLSEDNLSKFKLEYINSRLGTSIGTEEAQKLKIVTSLSEFLKVNRDLTRPNLTPEIGNLLEKLFVGFLATNNNRIMFRNTSSLPLREKDYRWYNVILNEKNLNPYTFYSIPNKIDLFYTDIINIHISEGIFDILSIYANLNDSNNDLNFYYASCGSSALNVIEFLIDSGINTGLNIHLYADKDKSDSFHMKYLMKTTNVYQWCDNIYIHRNGFDNEKDYGVPKERIKDTVRKIYSK